MKPIIPYAAILCFLIAVSQVDSAFQHTMTDIELTQDFNSFICVQDSLGADHYFTAEHNLAHFSRLHGGWAYESIDPVASQFSSVYYDDEFWVVYVSGAELRLVRGYVSDWRYLNISVDLEQPRNPDICVTDDGTVWVFASDAKDGSLWAWNVTGLPEPTDPVLIDSDGDCGLYLDATGLSTNGYHLVYHVGYPFFDMRQAIFDGTSLSIETIREMGSQGEHCSIVRGSDGSMHLAARDGYDNNLLYARLNEFGEWDWETPDARWGYGRVPSLVLNEQNRPVIAHTSSDYSLLEIIQFDGTIWISEEVPIRVDYSIDHSIQIIDPDEGSLALLKKYSQTNTPCDLVHATIQDRNIQSEIVCFSPDLVTKTQTFLDSSGVNRFFVDREDGYALWSRIGATWVHKTIQFDTADYDHRLVLQLGHGDSNRLAVAIGLSLLNQYQTWVDTWNGLEMSREPVEFISDAYLIDLDMCLSPDGHDQLQVAQLNRSTNQVKVRNLARQEATWISEIADEFFLSNQYDEVKMVADMNTTPFPTIAIFHNGIRVLARQTGGWSVSDLETTGTSSSNFDMGLSRDGLPRILNNYDFIAFTGSDWISDYIGTSGSVGGFDLDSQDRPFVIIRNYDEACHVIRHDGIEWVDETIGEETQDGLAWDCVFDGSRFVSLVRDSDRSYLIHVIESTPLPPTLELTMNDRTFSSGESFELGYRIANGPDPLHAQLAVLLDIPVGETHLYYSWPGWQDLSHGIPTTPIDLQTDQSVEESILSFTWPSGAGALSGLSFWGFLVNADGTGFAADTAHLYWHFK